MARALRILQKGAFYHVMNRGRGDSRIFLNDKDYEVFLKTAKEACGFFNARIIAYCLMPTHYHLLVHTPEGNLPRFMRHINGVYTQRINQRYKTSGSLFKGRYHAIIVQNEEYLLRCVRYIHLNPVKARIVNDRHLETYLWSSHGAYLKGKNRETWLDVEASLKRFKLSPQKAIKQYLKFLMAGDDDATKQFYESPKESSIFGSVEYIDNIKQEYLDGQRIFDIREIPEAKKIKNEKSIGRIIRHLCREFKITEDKLYHFQRGLPNSPKQIAIYLVKELTQLPNHEIARIFRLGSYKTVSAHLYRFTKKMEEDKQLSRRYKRLLERCSQEET